MKYWTETYEVNSDKNIYFTFPLSFSETFNEKIYVDSVFYK